MNPIVNELRDELRAAHIIIRNALGVATFDQKIAWGNANERDDVIGEGVTRAHERQTAINNGSGVAIRDELCRAHRIIANAADLLSGHQRELWFAAIRQDRACVSPADPTRWNSRSALLDRISVFDLLTLPRDGGSNSEGSLEPVPNTGVIGFDLGDPAGDQTVAVLKPIRELSADDLKTLRRVLASTSRNVDRVLIPAKSGPLTEAQVDAVMRQAEVFASAWSLIGGPFDNGAALETADHEKAVLRGLLRRFGGIA
ncbi:hypothetical protein [Burkholderia ambifaria]|jgi:hypothetical protein|uniref:hypothetical protein n=1 Tax=Burkholderia ambifaria TaxID=152480 RepID=UPI001FC7DFA4|nr:hypothetical protein [Burkholderia ambifaria]